MHVNGLAADTILMCSAGHTEALNAACTTPVSELADQRLLRQNFPSWFCTNVVLDQTSTCGQRVTPCKCQNLFCLL